MHQPQIRHGITLLKACPILTSQHDTPHLSTTVLIYHLNYAIMKAISLVGSFLALATTISAQETQNTTTTTTVDSSSTPTIDPSPAATSTDVYDPNAISPQVIVFSPNFPDFCTAASTPSNLCYTLLQIDADCVSEDNDCSESYTLSLLAAVIAADPCPFVATPGSMYERSCETWKTEAIRCRDVKEGVRGVCAHHHVLYLLGQCVTMLGLSLQG
ncbi:hypothetical protein BDV95DRAFT_358666 [Massariosphaeria phaeospora]|uniref:Uncharacterized protein n=1 Tax=Massariosphaeria phaeospora TaxID=100035 RepID=A0A7C8MGQ3_9PLEO|nr:hypothetical protein BDV95DRAFT_358666 [Massariosphaeria phaeospora]